MKKFILSLTVLMSIVGTSSSFGSTKNNHFQSPKTEQVVNTKSVKQDSKDTKTCDCKTCKELVKKHQTKKQTKQCNCKNCQKQQKKSGPTCKMQPNVRQTNRK